MLSTTSLLRPTTPSWLEAVCQQLIENDETYQTVELIHPRMDDGNAKAFAKALSENHTVTTLVLSCYAIVDDGTAAIASVLCQNTTITKLHFRDLRDVREISTFFQYLQRNTTITELSLRHCTICPRGAMAMAQYIKSSTTLQELRITDSQFISNAFQILCQHGLHHNSSIERLYFVNDDLSHETTGEYLAIIVDNNSQLQELNVGENNLGDDGVATLVTHILQSKTSTALHRLDLRSNNITCTGAMPLQGLLLGTPSLRTLILSDNDLGDHGIMALSRALQQQSKTAQLQILDVNGNTITPVGASALGTMLRVNKSLQALHVSFNHVGDDGVEIIVSALQMNQTLRTLSLRRNGITSTGAQCIANVLPNLQGLKELALSKNDIGPIGAAALLQGMQSNVELEYLHIDDYEVSTNEEISLSSSKNITRDISRCTKLNQAGRRVFRTINTLPRPLWSFIYGRISHDPDMVRT
jgi:Ran GTPase-activating protein (RanGAP) involved in mRNA processing and transport